MCFNLFGELECLALMQGFLLPGSLGFPLPEKLPQFLLVNSHIQSSLFSYTVTPHVA